MKISLITVALILLASCNIKEKNHIEENPEKHTPEGFVILNKEQRNALGLQLGTFQMRNLTTVVKVNGQLEVPPANRADVTVAIGGNVKSIHVFLSDKVNKGQLLAVLEHPDYITLQENFAIVASRMEYLKKDYERQKELFEKKVGSGKEYQLAGAEYNEMKAKYQSLKAKLGLLGLSPEKTINGNISNTVNVYAPINGFITGINVNIGTYADVGDILFEITDNSAVHADFIVYEKDVPLVREGQLVHFTVSNLPGKELTASVFAVGREFDPVLRAIHIHTKINGNKTKLLPGMYISGHLHTDEKYTRTLPNDAIVKEGTKSFIFVLDNSISKELHEDEKTHNTHIGQYSEDLTTFKITEVITGRKDDGYTEIHLIDPLPENTSVVLNAAYYLLADMKKEEVGEHEH